MNIIYRSQLRWYFYIFFEEVVWGVDIYRSSHRERITLYRFIRITNILIIRYIYRLESSLKYCITSITIATLLIAHVKKICCNLLSTMFNRFWLQVIEHECHFLDRLGTASCDSDLNRIAHIIYWPSPTP